MKNPIIISAGSFHAGYLLASLLARGLDGTNVIVVDTDRPSRLPDINDVVEQFDRDRELMVLKSAADYEGSDFWPERESAYERRNRGRPWYDQFQNKKRRRR